MRYTQLWPVLLSLSLSLMSSACGLFARGDNGDNNPTPSQDMSTVEDMGAASDMPVSQDDMSAGEDMSDSVTDMGSPEEMDMGRSDEQEVSPSMARGGWS